MLDIESRIQGLKRPALLAQAARFGVDDYRRDTVLPRLLDTDAQLRPGAALMALLSKEAECEDWRKKSAAHYRPALHVDLLIAVIAEARIWRATRNTL